ncbi:MAG: pseudouridine synthase [Alphaproteobacteria bacterium]|jgi:23S rRNA pseudouridine2605 synthase|nr:pseudouridine synthase [Alphaproteobacteria bacterium]
MTEAKQERIAKVLARAGLCSRREAERWIEAGRVAVDGEVLASPAFNVGTEARITVDGKPIALAEATRLWRYHKPRGLITSHRDPEGRPTVFEKLPAELPRVVSVGRLDVASEGLLLLTNDGELARHLELPGTGWSRRYRVRVHGLVAQARLDALAEGVTVEGMRYGPIEARLDRAQGANAWLTMTLKEGKNREIRRLATHLGLEVTRLIRIAYGPFQLGDLKRGEATEVKARVLADQLGPAAARFGLKLGGPQAKAAPKPRRRPGAGKRDAHRRRPA